MASEFEILLHSDDPEHAHSIACELFREIDRIERLLSRFEATSDIGRINSLRPGESIRVGIETMECLLTSLWLTTETGGAFDVTVGPLMTARNAANPEAITSTMPGIGMHRLMLNPKEYTVGVRMNPSGGNDEGVVVDLGGIGKGYALDRVASLLEEWEIDNILIHSASTALAVGPGAESDSGKGWSLGIGGDWGKQAQRERISLLDKALSGSGTTVRGQHIIDPISGSPAQGHLGAWAVSPSAAVADGLSTAFMVMSTDAVRRFCESHDEVGAFVISPTNGGTPVDLL